MHKFIFGCIIIISLVFLSGCFTLRNTAFGVAAVGQGVVTDAYISYKALEAADKWFQENYW